MNLSSDTLIFKLISEEINVNLFDCGNSSINFHLKSNALLDHYQRNGGTTVVFNTDYLVYGYVTLSREFIHEVNREVVVVQYLGVDKQYKGTGIGSKIIDYIKTLALATNERYIFLEALNTIDLIDWYSNRGFEVVDPEEIEDPMTITLWMYMDLSNPEIVDGLYNDP